VVDWEGDEEDVLDRYPAGGATVTLPSATRGAERRTVTPGLLSSVVDDDTSRRLRLVSRMWRSDLELPAYDDSTAVWYEAWGDPTVDNDISCLAAVTFGIGLVVLVGAALSSSQ
jgi:hypothetical protein